MFAFGPDEIPSINPTIIEHCLNVDPTHKLVFYKMRHMGINPCKPVANKVEKQLDTQFICKCHNPKCVSNVVLVKNLMAPWGCVWISPT